MNGERIREAIATRHRPGSVLKRVGGLKQLASLITGGGLPGPLRSVVEEAFAAPEHSRIHVTGRKRGSLGKDLADLSEADWRRAAETLLPQIGDCAALATVALARRPYQDGLSRKPFRCPRSPETLADVRARWLVNATILLGDYDGDIRWVTEHAAFLAGWSGGADMGWLLAAAIDLGGDTARDVREILTTSIVGEHPTAQMGRHVTQALMSCNDPSAWEEVVRLLLSAQRQEGLRQVILESVDEAHPHAFRRMLRVILDEDLTRFSSVVRAADTWFGFLWDGSSKIALDDILRRVLLFLEDPMARAAARVESDAETVYLALWASAFEDIDGAIGPATQLLSASKAEIRFVATHFLVQSLWTSGIPALVDALGDADLRVAARALDLFGTDMTSIVDGERLFQSLEQLMARLPKRSGTLDAIVWPWWKQKLERSTVAAALSANASAVNGDRLLPYVTDMNPAQRATFISHAAGITGRWSYMGAVLPDGSIEGVPQKRRKLSEAQRRVALDLLGDTSADVRSSAFNVMRELPLRDDEIDRLFDLLERKPGDLRTNAIARLRTLDDAALLALADRLVADASERRRLAGLELLRDAVESNRAKVEAQTRLSRYATDQPALSDEERLHVDAVAGGEAGNATLDNALGLVDPRSLRDWPEPRARRVEIDTPAARGSLRSLAERVLQHQNVEVRLPNGEVQLLAQALAGNYGPRNRESLETSLATLPVADTWRTWLSSRPETQRDRDGLESFRILLSETESPVWGSPPVTKVRGIDQWSGGLLFLRTLLEWCVVWDPPQGATEFLLDGLEDAIASLTADDYREMEKNEARNLFWYEGLAKEKPYRRKLRRADEWLNRFRWWRAIFPAAVSEAHAERLYGLLRWFEEKSRGFEVLAIILDDFIEAHRAGAVGANEFLNLLVGPWSLRSRAPLHEASTRKPPPALHGHPELVELVDRARRRIVEVETQRGDRETAASQLALALRMTGGLETLRRAVPALGKTHFARQFGWNPRHPSRQQTLSYLVIRSIPGDADTPEAFATWARKAKVRETRLVELAIYAPQWAAHVNHVLQWPGLDDGVWWIEAHTKDNRSWMHPEVKDIWAAEVSERTPLSAADLTEGAVDVSWFVKVYAELGPDRWKALDTAAKYAASSGGHTRAQLFARAMAGAVTRDELLSRIDASRHQDSVRALGLLPLAEGDARAQDLLERYHRLEEFRRQARKFGSQRQASEKRAVTIAMENLARTAGYRDPQRLQWAMERQAVADLANGPLVITRGEVTVELSIDADGVPALTIRKSGKAQKALPAKLKKDPEIEELKERLQELKRQHSRVRGALEEAMCRGDTFNAPELHELLTHPVLAPAVSRLVFVGDDIAGYPAEGGRALRDHQSKLHVLGANEQVRIAHPVDLFTRGDWSAWQRECFLAERIQPFKQLFRELYPMTATERGTERTRRYAGHQVNPRQALALLGSRGWVARPEEGVSRTFHEAGLTARLEFQQAFYTPADIEGLTLEDVIFTRKGEFKELPLDDVPKQLFSEAMRDLDLVVSVAHRGGVDPEATASTVEMRAALLRETCALLGLTNVEVQQHHAVIRGQLGEYSVHLGSAGAMLLPSTFLPIVAVHSQHRGRLFLPFADDDPRTAEVMSKVLLLARDKEIRDPNILEWIRAGLGNLRNGSA